MSIEQKLYWTKGHEAGVKDERERIINLLEDDDLQHHLYFWLEYGEHDKEGSRHKEVAIALIKGEQK